MKRVDLVGLLDAMMSPDRQMVTARMPAIRAAELHAVPESVELAEGTPQTIIDEHDAITKPTAMPIHVRFRKPIQKMRARAVPKPVVAPSGTGDMTLIGTICALSLTLCAALAWLG